MKTIGFVVPYFTCGNGTVHPMTQLWLDSCKNNSTIDWLFFTDCDLSSFDISDNVKVYKTTFASIQDRFQKIFDFDICLNKPYKLCDFKPIYGEAFATELKGYDYWGFCDIDLIWGNIRCFLTDDILESNDRILTHGHCSLFRNEKEVNEAYRTLDPKGCMDYKTVFSTEKLWAYDEWALHNGGGYARIEKLNGIKMYDEIIYADIQINRFQLHTTREKDSRYSEKNNKNTVFVISEGKVISKSIGENSTIVENEYIYVHFQQRKLAISDNINKKTYLIVPPNKAIGIERIDTEKELKKLTANRWWTWNIKGQCKEVAHNMKLSVTKGLK